MPASTIPDETRQRLETIRQAVADIRNATSHLTHRDALDRLSEHAPWLLSLVVEQAGEIERLKGITAAIQRFCAMDPDCYRTRAAAAEAAKSAPPDAAGAAGEKT